MYFQNEEYDGGTGTFTGSIIWGENSMNTCGSWDYYLVFSEDFTHIEGGQVIRNDVNGNHLVT
jgi:hypothetical protein